LLTVTATVLAADVLLFAPLAIGFCGSVTVNENVSDAGVFGALNVGIGAVVDDKETAGPAVCDQA
jgi:hypothetical protein